MRARLRSILFYSVTAALALACLRLITLSPLVFEYGRELAAAVIALAGVVVGMLVREHWQSRRVQSPDRSSSLAAGVGAEAAKPSLSSREREVLRLLVEGLGNKMIARRLSISENTVKTHLANVYGKLGVSKRVEAVVAAQRLGFSGDHPKITRPGDSGEALSSPTLSSVTNLPRSS